MKRTGKAALALSALAATATAVPFVVSGTDAADAAGAQVTLADLTVTTSKMTLDMSRTSVSTLSADTAPVTVDMSVVKDKSGFVWGKTVGGIAKPRSLTTNANGSQSFTMSIVPTDTTDHTAAALSALGAPQTVIDELTEGSVSSVPVQPSSFTDQSGTSRQMVTTDFVSGAKLFKSGQGTVYSHNGQGQLWASDRRYLAVESDPNYNYVLDQGKSAGFGSGGDDLRLAAIEHEYRGGWGTLIDFEPSSTYNGNTLQCASVNFSVSASAAGVGASEGVSLPVCPDKIYPSWQAGGATFMRGTWVARDGTRGSTNSTYVVGAPVLDVVKSNQGCCPDGYAFNVYATFA